MWEIAHNIGEVVSFRRSLCIFQVCVELGITLIMDVIDRLIASEEAA